MTYLIEALIKAIHETMFGRDDGARRERRCTEPEERRR